MAAFPINPVNGQTANINGIQYTYSAALTAWTVTSGGGSLTVATAISATGNVSGGNLNVTGNIVDTGPLTVVTGSNGNITLAPNGTGIVTVSSNISASGNITGSYYFGNGSQLTGVAASPGGATTQIQYNNNGAFGGITGFTYNGTTVTFTNPTVTNYTETRFTANSSTAITLDLANGTMQDITLTGSPTITMPTATAGKSFILLLRTGTGSYTVTWSTVKWPSGTAPTVTSTASKMDIYSFFSDGTNWYGTTVGQNYTP